MKKLVTFIGLSLLMTACVSNQETINPVLTVEGGQIQGVKLDSSEVIVYRGVPYTAPPVGDLRWKRPQPVVAWEGVKVADTFSDGAMQRIRNPKDGQYGTEFHFRSDDPNYSEDCLYLNIWAPAYAPGHADKKLPVAMWVHGGAYVGGWGFEMQMDGEAWAKRDVILVTINYRLGAFGFMSLPELSAEDPDGVSGNYGLLDQIAALQWVKNNIAQFGGDPDNIMIFGQSAGGASIRNLCVSPMSRDLIAKACVQSGGGLGDFIPVEAKPQSDYDKAGKAALDKLGFHSLAELRALPADSLYKATAFLGFGGGISYAPHIDGVILPESFEQATYNKTLADVPYLLGYTGDDMGDLSVPILNFAKVREDLSDQPTYCYLFDRKLPDDGRECLKGSFHSSELWYEFHTLSRSWRPFTEGDYDLSNRMVDAWTNFAKYSNPNGKTGDSWPSATKANPYIYKFVVEE
ncbi:MAG: carboxylesterase family protein [Bacteroidaceae bacterium]|nr:carboxylesterase family protein [Bacteroidaceae bacterium]